MLVIEHIILFAHSHGFHGRIPAHELTDLFFMVNYYFPLFYTKLVLTGVIPPRSFHLFIFENTSVRDVLLIILEIFEAYGMCSIII